MKKNILVLMTVILGVLLIGCEEDRVTYVEVDRDPAVPQGVYTITGDGAVYIYWLPVQDNDLAYYRVWWSDEADGVYEVVGTSVYEEFVDDDVTNGVTYFYAVTAVDENDNESDLSYATVFDTPRPEDYNQVLYTANFNPTISGFKLDQGLVVPWDAMSGGTPLADFFIDYDAGLETFFINVPDIDTDLQDMGYTENFDEITYAPSGGWSFVGWSEVIEGHTYVIWTRDDHFAKIRITDADYDNYYIVFDWAYQTASFDPGRMELSRPQHDEDFLKYDIKTKQINIVH